MANKKAIPQSSGRQRQLDNYKLAMGMGANWIDQDTGIMYHIQEYYEAIHNPKITKDKKPTKIRMSDAKTGDLIGWAEEWQVRNRMKDPEPDPKY